MESDLAEEKKYIRLSKALQPSLSSRGLIRSGPLALLVLRPSKMSLTVCGLISKISRHSCEKVFGGGNDVL